MEYTNTYKSMTGRLGHEMHMDAEINNARILQRAATDFNYFYHHVFEPTLGFSFDRPIIITEYRDAVCAWLCGIHTMQQYLIDKHIRETVGIDKCYPFNVLDVFCSIVRRTRAKMRSRKHAKETVGTNKYYLPFLYCKTNANEKSFMQALESYILHSSMNSGRVNNRG